jgi:chromate transporter
MKAAPSFLLLSTATPGLLATKVAAHTGYVVRGVPGSVVASIGIVLPSYLIMLTVVVLLSTMQNSTVFASFLKGIRPAVFGMLLATLCSIATKSVAGLSQFAVAALSFGAIWGLGISPFMVLFAAGVAGVFLL